MGFKSKTGQPPLYASPEELIEDIVDYMLHCEDHGKPLTITGFVQHSRFESRQSLWDYEQISEFSYPIRRFKLMVEADLNERLVSADSEKIPGIIFSLRNNFSWRERLARDT